MIPVITIDGPSGTGKGTIAAGLSEKLGFHCLDSGAFYRLVGLAATRAGADFTDGEALGKLAEGLKPRFEGEQILLDGEDVSRAIRTEQAGNAASKVALHPPVRMALRGLQRAAARAPGLIADGRDMGTAVFPDAQLKIYLDADADERAQRRYKQLKDKGMDASLRSLLREIRERDERDRTRAADPLCVPDGAQVVDTSRLSIDEVLEVVLDAARRVFPERFD